MELTTKYNPIKIPQEIKDEYPHLFYECLDCLDTGKVLEASEPDEEIIVKCHCTIEREEDVNY